MHLIAFENFRVRVEREKALDMDEKPSVARQDNLPMAYTQYHPPVQSRRNIGIPRGEWVRGFQPR